MLLAIAVMSLLAILSWRGLDGMVRAQEITRQRADEMLVLQAALVPPSVAAHKHKKKPVPHIVVADQAGNVVRSIPWKAPVPTIDKRHWWNFLIGNPAGYLPDDAGIDRIQLDLPANEYLPFGPAWLRAWYGIFFAAVLASSLAVKFWARID